MFVEVRRVALLIPVLLVVLILGCGGGGSSSKTTGDFSILVTPDAANFPQGGSASFSVSVTGSGGFDSAVNVSVSGLPTGVSASQSSFAILPGSSQTVKLTAASGATVGTTSVSFDGVSGTFTHAARASLQVVSSVLTTRVRFFQTDWAGNSATVGSALIYNAPTKRFFYAATGANEISVFDATTEEQLGSIAVPAPLNLDQAPDGSVLYAASSTNNIYVLDPNALTITQKHFASSIGPSGFSPNAVFALGDGNLALYEDGTLAVWDMSSNILTRYDLQTACAATGALVSSIQPNAMRTELFVTTYAFLGLDEYVSSVCEFNPSTGQAASVAGGSGFAILPTPDGSSFLTFGSASNPATIYVWNATTLAVASQFTLPGTFAATTGVFSTDGNTLYSVASGVVLAYNWRNGTLEGWASAPVTTSRGALIPLAIDGTGLIAGTELGGVGFADASSLQTTAPMSSGPYTITENVGVNGSSVTINALPSGQTPAGVYFDYQAAPSFTVSGTTVTAAAPAHAAGPVDVAVVTAQGAVDIAYSGFSYGPDVSQVFTNLSTEEGGGTAILTGYGLAPFYSGTGIPANTQVKVDSQASTIISFTQIFDANINNTIPLQVLQFTIPPGQAGTSATITVSNNFGTSTAAQQMTYLPAVQTVSLARASLVQGVYSPDQGLYYFADNFSGEIQVFSRTSMSWQTPIPLPSVDQNAHQFGGIALSPDGTKLAISDSGMGAIFVLNPSNPSAVQSLVLPLTGANAGISVSGLTISDSGIVYYAASLGLHEWNISTSAGSAFSLPFSTGVGAVLLSPDESSAYAAGTGEVVKVTTATGALSSLSSCCWGFGTPEDFALSSDGSTLVTGMGIQDSNGNAVGVLAANPLFPLGATTLGGQSFSADGNLVFQPQQQGIAVINAATGNLVQSIGLPVVLNSLVNDGTDNVFVGILSSGNGVAVVDLTAVPETASIARPTKRKTNRNVTRQFPLRVF